MASLEYLVDLFSSTHPAATNQPPHQTQPQYPSNQYGQPSTHANYQPPPPTQYQQPPPPIAQYYQQSYDPATPAPYVTPQHTGNYPQQGPQQPLQQYGQLHPQGTQQYYQNPTYPQASPGYSNPQPPPHYGQPHQPQTYGQPQFNPGYGQANYSQYQQPQPQHNFPPQQSALVPTPAHGSAPPFATPQSQPQPHQQWHSSPPAPMNPYQSQPPPQSHGVQFNNHTPVAPPIFHPPPAQNIYQQQSRQSNPHQSRKKSKSKHRHGRNAQTDSGFAAHPSDFAVDLPRENTKFGPCGERLRSQSLANASQTSQKLTDISSLQLPPALMAVDQAEGRDVSDDFEYMSQFAFQEPQSSSPAQPLGNALSNDPSDEPVLQSNEDAGSSVSRFATEYNQKEFMLSAKDSHRWSYLQHDPAFKEYAKKHDNIPMQQAEEWFARKEGVSFDRSRKRSRSAEVAMYDSEAELSETSTLQLEGQEKNIKKKNKKSKLAMLEGRGNLIDNSLLRAQSVPAARERTPCIQVDTTDAWGPDPGEVGAPSSPPDPTAALLATLGGDDEAHVTVFGTLDSYTTEHQSAGPPPGLPVPTLSTQQPSTSQAYQSHSAGAADIHRRDPSFQLQPNNINMPIFGSSQNGSVPPSNMSNRTQQQPQQQYGGHSQSAVFNGAAHNHLPHTPHNHGLPNGHGHNASSTYSYSALSYGTNHIHGSGPCSGSCAGCNFLRYGSDFGHQTRRDPGLQGAHERGQQYGTGGQGHHPQATQHVSHQSGNQWHSDNRDHRGGYHQFQHSPSSHSVSGQQSATNLYNNCTFHVPQSSHPPSGPPPNSGNGAAPPPPPPPPHNPHNNNGGGGGSGGPGNGLGPGPFPPPGNGGAAPHPSQPPQASQTRQPQTANPPPAPLPLSLFGGGYFPTRSDSGYASERGSWTNDSAPQSASTTQPSPLCIDTSQRPGTASSEEDLSPTSRAVLGLGEDEEFLGKFDPRKPSEGRHRRPKRPPPVVDEAYGRRW